MILSRRQLICHLAKKISVGMNPKKQTILQCKKFIHRPIIYYVYQGPICDVKQNFKFCMTINSSLGEICASMLTFFYTG
jgi:hypothetical protein